MIQSFRGVLSNLKTKKIGHDAVALACSVPTTPKGDMYNPADEEKPLSSARTYSKLFVRHWDAYATENKAAVVRHSLSSPLVLLDAKPIPYLHITPLHTFGSAFPSRDISGTSHTAIPPKMVLTRFP